jgi:hypothetical protein
MELKKSSFDDYHEINRIKQNSSMDTMLHVADLHCSAQELNLSECLVSFQIVWILEHFRFWIFRLGLLNQ